MIPGISSKKGASIIEYSVLSAVFILAVLAIQVYMVRALNGRIKDNTDSLGQQYSPSYSNYAYHLISHSQSQEVGTESGETTSTLLQNEVNGKTPYVENFRDNNSQDKPLAGTNAERLFE